MTSWTPCVKGQAYEFGISLFDTTNTQKFKTSPTLAAGDVKISKDGGAFSNLASLPGVVGVQVIVSLTASETNADRLYVTFQDAAGNEWTDLAFNIFTTARNFDALAYPAVAGTTIESAVWDALTASHATAGTFGAAVAASADPWATSLPGSYTGTQAGNLIGTYIDAAISSRLPTANINLDGSGRVDVGAIVGSTTAASNLSTASRGLASGTVGSSSTTTSVVTSITSPSTTVANQFAGRLLTFTSDTGTINLRGVMVTITSNTAGGVFTVSALPVAPSSGDTFVIT